MSEILTLIKKPEIPRKLVKPSQPIELIQPSEPKFMAVGVITGEVDLSEKIPTITIQGKSYPLFFLLKHNRKRYVLDILKGHIEAGNREHRLVVYPKPIHFPDRNKFQDIRFEVIGILQKDRPHAWAEAIGNGYFILAGLWQFIPVCKVPCVSVFRNHSEQLVNYLKSHQATERTRVLKAGHCPLFWRDSSVKPFRFNPKLKDQGKPKFIQVKARFLPHKNAFAFVEELAPPMDQAPRFCKVRKEDKQEALAEAKRRAAEMAEKRAAETAETAESPEKTAAESPEKRPAEIPESAES